MSVGLVRKLWHSGVTILGLLMDPFFLLKIYSPMMDVINQKRILSDCFFSSNQIPAKFSILTLLCAWHRVVFEIFFFFFFNSMVSEFLKNFNWLFRRNLNRIRKYCKTCLSRGPDGFDSWKKLRSKILWNTPFKSSEWYCICLLYAYSLLYSVVPLTNLLLVLNFHSYSRTLCTVY